MVFSVETTMLTFVTVLVILIIGVVIIKQSEKDKPKKILKVYSQKGRWYRLKYCIIALMLFLRRIKFYLFGKTHFNKEKDLDKLQELSNHEKAFDAVFFHAVSQNGIYFCAGTERRHNGKVVGLVYLVHPDYGILESEKLPDTILDADVDSLYNKNRYAGEGICFTPVVPMKKWKVSYNGLMRVHDNPNKLVQAKFEVDWTSNYNWFFFEVDVPIKILAKAIATEPWSKQLFQNLKDAHQSHYEQMGYINGTVQLDGKTTTLTDVDAFRDHSFGMKRDWSIMHRYIYMMFYLSDRTKIAMGVVSQPCTTSHLEMGFVNHPDGRLDPIDSIDLILFEHAENGVLPKELGFTFQAKGKFYQAKMKFLFDSKHYKGNNREAVMNERFHECEINGVPGKGISEWHYNKYIFE